jgi:hypothetical protein
MEVSLTADASTNPSSDADVLLRARHSFENEQLHRRVTWQGQFQAFFFAALALAWRADDANPLIAIIALLGLVIAGQGIFAIAGVGMSLMNTERQRRRMDPENLKPDVFGLFEGSRQPIWRYFPSPEICIPIAFFAAWTAVLCVRFYPH